MQLPPDLFTSIVLKIIEKFVYGQYNHKKRKY